MTEKNRWIKDSEDVEISLKDLFYTIFKSWRGIIVFALCLAFAAGGFKYVSSRKANMAVEGEISAAEEQLKSYEIRLDSARKQYEAAELLLKAQTERLDASAVMKLDPAEAVYLEQEYELKLAKNLFGSVTSEKKAEAYKKLIDAYDAFVSNDVLTAVADQLGRKKSDLQDLVIVRGEPFTRKLYVGVFAADYEEAKQLVDACNEILLALTVPDSMTDIKYSIDFAGERLYDDVEQDIVDIQLKYISNITEIRESLNDAESALKTLEAAAPAMPGMVSSIKEFVKFFIVGGVAAGVIAVMFVCAVYLMSGKLKSEKQFAEYFNLMCFGTVSAKDGRRKRVLACVDGLIDYLFSVGRRPDFENSCAFAAAGIKNALDINKLGKNSRIVFTGSIAEADMEEVCGFVKERAGLTNVGIFSELTNNFNAVESLPSADAVILVEKAGKSNNKDIEAELLLLDNNHAPLLGVVIIDGN